MPQDQPLTVSTAQLRLLLAEPTPPWLVYAPDHAAFSDGHIPGSLSASDGQLLAVLPREAQVVTYGEHHGAEHAKALAVTLQTTGRIVRWYDGGLRAWASAGLPIEGARHGGEAP